jgi:addiction module HigA family antidote
MLPRNRAPTTPGEMLRSEFLEPLGMTQEKLAEKMSVPVQTVRLILKGEQEITASTAQALATALGTTPEFWISLQYNLNLSKQRP